MHMYSVTSGNRKLADLVALAPLKVGLAHWASYTRMTHIII